MPEIDPWLLAYLTAVAVWSFSMAFFVGPWAIRKRTDDPNGKLTLSLVGLFRRTFREEVKSDEFKGALKEAMPAFQLPDTAALGAKLEAITTWANSVTPLVNNLSEGNLLTVVNTAIKSNFQGGKMRGDGGGGAPTALENALNDAEWAVTNPDQAQALAVAHSTIDNLVPVFNWSPARVKHLHEQANAAKGSVEGLQRLMAMLDKFQGGGVTRGGRAGAGPV